MLRINHPFSLVIFGASGHLAKIKIFPALYVLALKKRFPANYAIVGYARTSLTDDAFRTHVRSAVMEQMGGEVNAKVLDEFLSHCVYHTGSYDAVEDFSALAKRLETMEKSWPEAVRLAYLSIPPSAFRTTLEGICRGKVHRKGQPFRCIVEKPVGMDLVSYGEIASELQHCFASEEVYILDHYLGKEAVRNVYYLRHANPVIERLLKNSLINNVQITASESAGLEGRVGYFDAVGTLRDMFQSHLLLATSLLTMRLVASEDDMAATRLDALKKIYLPPASNLSEIIMQGQYTQGKTDGGTIPGYRQEEGVRPGSRTATFAALALSTRSSRWEGVPIFLKSGKRLKTKETRITLEFQDAPHLIGKAQARNRLDIILQGEAGMKLHLQTKLGGSEPKFRELLLEDPLVCIGDCLPEHGLLLLEAINGNRAWFLDPEEVRVCWRLIDPLQKYLDDPKTSLAEYAAGSGGPKEAEAFIAFHGHAWF
jgi:glucose-6-phosphate 1-dehydrogenase